MLSKRGFVRLVGRGTLSHVRTPPLHRGASCGCDCRSRRFIFIGAREYRQTERKRYADEADAELGKSGREHGTSTTASTSQNVPKNSAVPSRAAERQHCVP